MGIILLVILIVLLFGGFHPHVTSGYGYAPGGIVGVLLIVLLVLLLLGRI